MISERLLIFLSLQSRACLGASERGADPLGRAPLLVVLDAVGEDVAAHLAHALLLLHGHVRLLVGDGQRVGDADEQGRDGYGPRGAAAEEQRRLEHPRRGLVLVPEPAARRGRDDVAQGRDPLG